MIAYKLVRKLKDGNLTSLFINKTERIPIGIWLEAKNYPTKGYKIRPFWHCTSEMKAPHLSHKNRVWVKVELDGVIELERSAYQGGTWLLAKKMKVLHEIN